ncbi:hemerythrin domain-containing protein [Actinopolymorpha alba]|uniref:hemerythrin domain-containing protein n=1 Tax=Actinopolymorpha alba TaxID=533267 RepID=UPI00039B92CF|nr:hemerythrin domain-containing protein [Actinopolymorpha alba]
MNKPQRDMIDVLVADHRELRQLFTQVERDKGQPAKRRRQLADVVIAELVRHEAAEGRYLYPTARRVIPNGDTLADQELSEHAEAEKTMKQLQRAKPSTPEFERLLDSLMQRTREHLRQEESEVFPKLREACSKEELRELGRKVEVAKAAAPTRPHPHAPDKPPLNKLLGPGTGIVDKVRDLLTRRPTSRNDLKGK